MSIGQVFARLCALAVAFIAFAAIAAYAGENAPSGRAAAPLCCIYMIF
jgi:hypothetical protein